MNAERWTLNVDRWFFLSPLVHSFTSKLNSDAIPLPHPGTGDAYARSEWRMIDADDLFFSLLRLIDFIVRAYICRVTDPEAVSMARFLVEKDGLFVGSSSACNLVAAVKYVKKMGWKDGQTVTTIL